MASGAQRVRNAVAIAITLGCVMTLVGCGKREEAHATAPVAPVKVPEMKPAPATPIHTERIELGGETWDPEWDKIVELALPPAMLTRQVPRDVQRFCPRFYEMAEVDKRAFWAYFFQALAGAEAGLDPTTRVRHTEPEVAVIDKVSGRAVRSEGLLQLTYEDQRRYGCDFDWDHDKTMKHDDPDKTILQPKNNLECGVKILENQIIDQHKPLLSNSGYWSTLRSGNMDYRLLAKQMTNVPLACKARNSRTVASR
ncbi:hypothetical protein [Edaphobacter modestus]|uniref:Transglycosylase-like protein with SLT domain n=1 Tax=Edaphobacter modestus TaxID=388466 RepID=A0A4Q7YVU2_9BACT|nr:hypothetical protein [Edaphobacter modestus]RZU42012.1 hypothetical protein BDD14_3554 [Edaphobacter modestus]